MNVAKELEGKQLLLLVLPSQKFGEITSGIVKEFQGKRVLYVTLNNPYSALTKLWEQKKINCQNSFFIDGISAKSKSKVEAPNCVFVSAPQALTQLSIAINKTIKVFKPEMMVFDSLSTLLIYLPVKNIIGFCQSLSTQLKETGVKVIFPIIKNDELVNNISMFVDEVKEWKEEKGERDN